jgi:uncharacterized membrane protein YoaK (UPF0700 family)
VISKLPRWVWLGSFVLAAVGGMVNVVGLLGFEHQAITHLTGTTTMLGAAVADGSLATTLHFAAMLAAFVFGTVISGLIIQDTALQLGRRYPVALMLEAGLLFLAIPLLWQGREAGMYAATCACGLQNAMVSTYSGAVVRTTHLSGMFTDLGISLGHWLRGIAVDARRLRLCFLIISGYLCGGVAGTLAFRALGYTALAIPGAIVVAIAGSYSFYRRGWGKRQSA